LILLAASFANLAAAKSPASNDLKADERWVRHELQKMKLSSHFIQAVMASYQKDSFEKVLKLNLLGFLQPPQHMDLVTPEAASETSRFLKENQKSFAKAQAQYKVSPEVISALLWVETRHGDNVGQFHITSVFLDLLQTNRSANRKELIRLALLQNKKLNAYSPRELTAKMKERTERKSEWARSEIRALAGIFEKNQLDLKTLRGSYAGAFGLSQFLPSSYRDYAKSAKAKSIPNLMKPSDAILSVAHYLARHGWQNRKSKLKVNALMSYNNSRDYADSILEISKQASNTRRISSAAIPQEP
jgi:membrane-bound lytic murein transglycosylase B